MSRPATAVLALAALFSTWPAEVDAAPPTGPRHFKQLAGPPSEFADVAPAEPADAALRSTHALFRAVLEQVEADEWSWETELAIEAGTSRLVVVSPEAESWRLTLRHRDRGSTVSAEELLAHSRPSRVGVAGANVPALSFELPSLEPGTWQLRVASSRPGTGLVVARSSGGLQLESRLADFNQLAGERITLLARLLEPVPATGGEVTTEEDGGLAPRLSAATLRVTTPAGAVVTVTMRDDGLDGDLAPGDGSYAGTFLAERPGDYQVQVRVAGSTAAGEPFLRTNEHLIPVVAASAVGLTTDAATLAALPRRPADRTPRHLRFDISVTAAPGDVYRAFAEVWGTPAGGDTPSVPVAWIGGLTAVDRGALSFHLDDRWLRLAGAGTPLELRNVRLEETRHFVTVATADRLPVRGDLGPLAESPGRPIEIDREMRLGRRPRDDTSVESGTGSGHQLLLVHGYCSSDVWGPVSDQFTDASLFVDLGQNRLNDEFAQLLLDFGATWESYAVVGHSQGGLAALHLYAHYWSGLDAAGPGRLIQSVGSPYQGTPLAGFLAILGEIFGAGCGTNANLTPEGAAKWLAGIGTSFREEVHYHTTSFELGPGNDYCHLASDLFLSDPEDGVVEQSRGQLPSGVNQGHEVGWCHSSDMRDPPQTTDAARNAVMDATAATGRPDLSISDFSVSATTLDTSEPFTLFATVLNDGGAESAASTLRYYLSGDATVEPTDAELGSDPIDPIAPGDESSQSLDTAAPAAPGSYYVGACVEAVAHESDVDNNCSAGVEVVVEETLVGPLTVAGHSVDDDANGASSGDGDGIAECGETIELGLELLNQGNSAAQGVTAVLGSSDPHFLGFLDNDSSTYPDIAGGESAGNDDDFELTLPADVPDGHGLAFDVDIASATGGPWMTGFSVPIGCPDGCAAPDDLVVSNEQIDDPREYEACTAITVGPAVSVEGPAGHARFTAPSVAFESGVVIEAGAGLAVVNDLPLPAEAGTTSRSPGSARKSQRSRYAELSGDMP